ncbi:TetR-like C-terminal domain-containing protein [Lacticaseibacillus pabuli]|uniref:TetR-like C-terminal domain-containing protein n=1 Tax=Lacticaseibacillus pabuli TaxID=3025672 RepID=A0ABY7WSY0_9LACO|nr:TetR-like C-terminal domain-containing protein [Lacticaseibacillus sp. KACC 23028]WDF83278.1 TetR-like C-terminal domain-containing protein [Lacticaseibacillus sp. KACC 23028]
MLCRHAHVSRSYYYKHFVTFDDVIRQAAFAESISYLRSLPDIASNQTNVKMAHYFELMARTRDERLILLRVGKQEVLTQTFATVQQYLYEHNYIQLPDGVNSRRPYWLEFLAGAVVNVAFRWLQNGCQETPAQMGQLIADFIATK